jgi:hypothetical protein
MSNVTTRSKQARTRVFRLQIRCICVSLECHGRAAVLIAAAVGGLIAAMAVACGR